MNGRQLMIGILVALLVFLAVGMAASLGAILFLMPVRSGPAVEMPDPREIRIPNLPVRLGSAAFEQAETEVKSAPASSPSSLELENQIGNTVIIGANVQEVQVRATRRGRGVSMEAAAEDLRKLQVEVAQQQDRVVVTAGRAEPSVAQPYSGSIDLEVTVPMETALTLRALLGNVRLADIRGPIKLVSNLGNLEASGLEGDLDVTAKMGNIEITDTRIARSLRLVNEMGQVGFQGELPAQGEGEIQTKMGNVTVELPPANSAAVEARVKMGKIKSDFPGDLSSGPSGNLGGSRLRIPPQQSGEFLLRIQNDMGNVELKKTP
ncbi:MAG: DUF4097 family beta strand repeat-containing protein [Chloroflexota bacterium]